MLVGHHAVGFAAKRLAPRVSLGTFQAACVLPDVLTAIFQLMGIERARITPGITAFSALEGIHISFSHSLAMDLVWAGLVAVTYGVWRRDRRAAWVLFAVVVSHWLLDVASHRPQIPLAPGVEKVVGLGLWNSVPATFAVEGALWLVGIGIYLQRIRPASRVRATALALFVGVLTVAWISMPLGGLPPGDFTPSALIGLLVVNTVLFALAYWSDQSSRSRVAA